MDEQFKLFMQFYYPEIKDFTLHFLTLISGIFTFSVVFAEKVVKLKSPLGKEHIPIIIAWFLFIFALILDGVGLWNLFTAGEMANGSIVYQYDYDFIKLVRSIYYALNLAGVCFVVGLIMLAISALMNRSST